MHKYIEMFFDILQFKSSHDTILDLQFYKTYQELFNVKLHPFLIRMLVRIDTAFTAELHRN